jgi:hypothetical protein
VKRIAIALSAFGLIMLMFILAGCGGDFASPTTTDYETTTTTTTAIQSAEMTQTHNRSVCVGILNIGSCNTVQVNTQTQTVHKVPGVLAPAPSNNMSLTEVLGITVLLCVAFFIVVGIAGAVMGSGGYN